MNLHHYKEFLYISFFSLDSIPVFCSWLQLQYMCIQ
jgi:hypothetical protein